MLSQAGDLVLQSVELVGRLAIGGAAGIVLVPKLLELSLSVAQLVGTLAILDGEVNSANGRDDEEDAKDYSQERDG